MPRPSCLPCCDPTSMSRGTDTYRQSMLIATCEQNATLEEILGALGGGTASSIRYDYETLCDPGTGNPVFVRWEYDTTGAVTGSAGFNADGTAYVGSLAALVACSSGGGAGTSTHYDYEVLCNPVGGTPVFVRWEYDTTGTVVGSSGFLADGTAYVGDLNLLIACAGGEAATGTRYDYEVLCNPVGGTPVFVRWEYDTTGTVVGSAAFLADGTVYGGALNALVACGSAAAAGAVRYDYEVLCNPVGGAPVFVRWEYDIDGTVVGTSGFLADGTAYGGSLAALEACGGGGAGGSSDITSVIPGVAATNLGKAEDAVAASGDTGTAQLLKRTDTPSAQTDTDGDYTVPVANSFGATQVNIDSGFQRAAATGLLKLEDAASATGDAGVSILLKRTDTAAAQTDTTGDYILPVANTFGAQHVNIDSGFQKSASTGLLKLEDASHNDGEAGVMALGVSNSNLDGLSGTVNDYTPLCLSKEGILFSTSVAPQPSGATAATLAASTVRYSNSSLSGDTAVTHIGSIRQDTPVVDTSLTARTAYVKSNSVGALWVQQISGTIGGLTPYQNLDVNATGVLISTGAHTVSSIYWFNQAATVRYGKLYNKATAPTVGTDTPVHTYPIPPGSGVVIPIPQGGIGIVLGLGIGATTGFAIADTGAPAANDVIVNIDYK